jgi:hypothetical protein
MNDMPGCPAGEAGNACGAKMRAYVEQVGNVRVVGCQPYEAFEEAARRAGARRRS